MNTTGSNVKGRTDVKNVREIGNKNTGRKCRGGDRKRNTLKKGKGERV